MRKQLFSTIIAVLLIFCTTALSQDRIRPRGEVETPGYFYVAPVNVSQDTTTAAITLTIPKFPRDYKQGIQIVFKTRVRNVNNANITIKVSGKSIKKLLTHGGEEFDQGELDAGIMLTATYDGTHFLTDYNKPRQFRYVHVTDLTRTGNAYSVADTAIPPVETAPVMLGIKATATNTGDVTLSVNGGTAHPVFLSDGTQIPSGALQNGEFILCVYTTSGTAGFRALNLRPARSLRGPPIASLDIPAGDYVLFQFVGPWVIESGVTEVSAGTLPAMSGFLNNPNEVADSLLVLPTTRITTSQLGWYYEIKNGTTVVNTGSMNFGDAGLFGTTITTDDPNIIFSMQHHPAGSISGITAPAIAVILSSAVTIPAGYSIDFYMSEN